MEDTRTSPKDKGKMECDDGDGNPMDAMRFDEEKEDTGDDGDKYQHKDKEYHHVLAGSLGVLPRNECSRVSRSADIEYDIGHVQHESR